MIQLNVVAKYDSLHSLTQEMPIYLEEVLDNPTHDNHTRMRENLTWDSELRDEVKHINEGLAGRLASSNNYKCNEYIQSTNL